MVPVPLAASALVLLGVLVLVVIVVGSLIAAAVLQYKRAQEGIAEKRAKAAELSEREREQAERKARIEAEFSQVDFTVERGRVREERAALARLAREQAPAEQGALPDSTLLVPQRWLLERPLRLDPEAGEVVVRAQREPGPKPPPAVRKAFAAWRPRTSIPPTFPRHVQLADAIVELEEPPAGRYVDRDCYRVVSVESGAGSVTLELGATSYFAVLDEAVALECDVVRTERRADDQRRDGAELGAASSDDVVPLRDVIPDPFDVDARTTVASVSTLVLRRAVDGTAEFWLHRRRTVGMVGGQTHVVPSGVFQPAIDDLPEVFARDAAPWWTVVRETAEELLGMWNVDERSLGDDVYDTLEPLAALEAPRREGTARPWLVGLGLDPLSLWLELLTVLVVDAETFDAVIGQPPRENGEGTLVGRTRPDGSFGGLPFTEEGIAEAVAITDLAPAADGLLRLAWQHRSALL